MEEEEEVGVQSRVKGKGMTAKSIEGHTSSARERFIGTQREMA